MSPDRKTFLPLLTAVTLAAAACTDAEPPIVCESSGPNYTGRVTITKTNKGEDREEIIRLNQLSFLKDGVGVVSSGDEECGTSVTEFYSDPKEGIVVNGTIEPRGSKRVQWHSLIEPYLFNPPRLSGQNTLELKVSARSDGKVFFYRSGSFGWTTEIGEPKLPNDVLNEQTLQDSRIKIYQGKGTKLYLRNNVFDIPLFEDARDGKFAGLSVVLIDAGDLAPENFQDKPDEITGHYQLFRKAVSEENKRLNEELMGLEEYRREKEEEFTRNQITSERYESVKQFYEKEKAELLEKITKINKPPLGIFMDGRRVKKVHPEWVQDQPELSESITIYIAVGGEFKPQPNQSHPKRKQFPEQKVDPFLALFTNDYRIDTTFATPGYVIHHEASHYETGDSIFGSEYQTDTKALERIEKGLYPFVFVDGKGLTYTKKLPVLRGEGSNQPPLPLSFAQRFHPYKFTANGFLKPQYAPKKLGV